MSLKSDTREALTLAETRDEGERAKAGPRAFLERGSARGGVPRTEPAAAPAGGAASARST